MEIEWDEAKNRENIAKHGLDFLDASQVFESPVLERIDNRFDYGEERSSQTDWDRVANMKDEEIDYSDIPKLRSDFFENAQIRWPGTKKQITLRLDPDVVDFFKHFGKGYQRAMNNVLRKYMETHQQ